MQQNTQEKFVTYEEIQANPMLKWFFERDREIKRTADDEFFKEWQEYVKNEDMERVYFLDPLKGKEPREAILNETAHSRTMAQSLFFGRFSYEYYEFILQFIHDKKYLNILLHTLKHWKMELEDIKKLCSLLVNKGANPNALFYHVYGKGDCWYETLLHRYCSFTLNDTKQGREKQLEIVQFLLELGADPNIKNSSGENMLHLALCYEEQKLANLIIQSGKIDVNTRVDKYKDAVHYDETALNIAVSSLYSSTVKLLLEAGADANAINHYGKTPLDACGDRSATIEKYLRKAGGKSLLEILGSEEKVKEYQELKEEEWKIAREKDKEYKQKLWEDYKEAFNKTTSLAFLEWIEVERK